MNTCSDRLISFGFTACKNPTNQHSKAWKAWSMRSAERIASLRWDFFENNASFSKTMKRMNWSVEVFVFHFLHKRFYRKRFREISRQGLSPKTTRFLDNSPWIWWQTKEQTLTPTSSTYLNKGNSKNRSFSMVVSEAFLVNTVYTNFFKIIIHSRETLQLSSSQMLRSSINVLSCRGEYMCRYIILSNHSRITSKATSIWNR